MSKYQPILFSLGIAAVITVCGVNRATAQQPTFFADRQLYEAATEQLTLESFEMPFAVGASIQLPTVSITEISSLPSLESLRRSTAETFATDGFASLEYFSDGPSTIKIIFDEPITAFAIDLISFGNASGGELLVTDNGSMSSPHTLAVAPPSLMPLNTLFIGYVSPDDPFTEVMLSTSTSGDTIAMDNLSFGQALVVPEPSAIVLALLSIATLTVVRRRQRRPARS